MQFKAEQSMLKNLILLLTTCFIALFSAYIYADNSPVGLWKTFDDSSGKLRSLIRISNKMAHSSQQSKKAYCPATPLTCVTNARARAKTSQLSAW